MIANNEHKLPLFYSGKSSSELLNDNKEDKVLEEFIVNCLLDPTFVPFVSKVQSVLNNIVTKELNSDSWVQCLEFQTGTLKISFFWT